MAYLLAKAALTQADIDRILCVYVNSPMLNESVDWERARLDYNSTSIASFKVLVGQTRKKILTAVNDGVPGMSSSPKTASDKKRASSGGKASIPSKRRKAARDTDPSGMPPESSLPVKDDIDFRSTNHEMSYADADDEAFIKHELFGDYE